MTLLGEVSVADATGSYRLLTAVAIICFKQQFVDYRYFLFLGKGSPEKGP